MIRTQGFQFGRSAGICFGLLTSLMLSTASASDSLRKNATWSSPSADEVAVVMATALSDANVAIEQVDATVELFRNSIADGNNDVLTAFVISVGSVLAPADELIKLANRSPTAVPAENYDRLGERLSIQFKLWVARDLVRIRLYDEAIALLSELQPEETVDPASTMFYRAAASHALLDKETAINDLERLLENEEDAPVRFIRTARLMLSDIKPLKKDSIDEISRLMNDVGRRLDLGRSGAQVQEKEQEIIDKLAKLIEKIEEEQQQQQQKQEQHQQQQQQNSGDGKPLDDSRIAGANGKGDVDKKNLDDESGWGNLPPAERQEALQQISRDLPTHYREAIEAYFRKMATEQK